MERRAFGNTDMDVSVLGFGGAEIGFQNVSTKQAEELLQGALDAGLNVIDTAECYGNSEELIGQTISGRRGDFHLFTKVGHPDGMPTENWSPESILASIERSLRRMSTDTLDLVFLHSCDEDVLRQGDAIAALQEARDRGHTRYIGYSGDGQAALYAVESGAFDALQISVNIADQEALDRVMPKALDANLGVVAKRPIANAAWRTGAMPTEVYHQPYWERLQKLDYAFLKDELRESIAVALRFTLSVPGVHTAIVGTTRPGRWQDNAELAAQGALPVELFQDIRMQWSERAENDWIGLT